MNFRKNRSEESDLLIDIAPLIDVVFILLIFFMVTTTFSRESALEIELPQTNMEPQQNVQRDELVISIDAQGQYAVNTRSLFSHDQNIQGLEKALKQELVELKDKDFPVVIFADGKASHQSVVTAMEAAKNVGLSNFSLQTGGGATQQ
jgi:biopolymer transport protein ExbD